MKIQTLNEEHKTKLGVYPYIIGMYWQSPDILIDSITQAIKTNTPYNEYNLLTKEEQVAFDAGKLLF